MLTAIVDYFIALTSESVLEWNLLLDLQADIALNAAIELNALIWKVLAHTPSVESVLTCWLLETPIDAFVLRG